MRKFLNSLWACKTQILIAWIFFFSLSLSGNTPYSIISCAIKSLLVTLVLMVIGILLAKTKWYKSYENIDKDE
jgi:hypothetical protein